jgi:hypothetical protein
MDRRGRGSGGVLRIVLGVVAVVAMTAGDVGAVVMCPDNGNAVLPKGGDGQDLEVTGTCTVQAGEYAYGNVNIFGTSKKPAVLRFRDAEITFSARSILVENDGFLLAGWSQTMGMPKPIGTNPSGSLTIRLYGSDTDQPIACKSGPMCGVDPAI